MHQNITVSPSRAFVIESTALLYNALLTKNMKYYEAFDLCSCRYFKYFSLVK